MKLHKDESGNIAMFLILLVAGLVIGFAAARVAYNGKIKSADNNSSSSSSSMMSGSSSTSATALQTNLVTLGVEHMTYTDQAVDAALDGSPNASATAAALYANGNDIGAAVGSVYGSSAQSTFDQVWKLHLDQFVAYATADKQGNQAGKTAALNTIQTQYTVPLAQFLAKANPNLPEATVQSSLEQHISMTAIMIDDHVKGNYTAEASELNMANTHIAGLFSTLAGAIVKQFPSKFSS